MAYEIPDIQKYVDQATQVRETLPSGISNSSVREDAWALAGQLLNNDFQYQMWTENNKYNTPEAQMKRLVQAGLNPHLAYQNVTSGNSSAPSSGGFDFAAAMNAGSKRKQVEIQKTQAITSTISQSIEMMQQFFGMIQQGQQVQANSYNNKSLEMQYALDKYLYEGVNPISNSGGFKPFSDGGIERSNPNIVAFYERFMPGVAKLWNEAQNSGVLRDLQKSNTNINKFRYEHLLPLDESIKKGLISSQDWQDRLLKYQSEMLETLPAEFRTLYFTFVLPMLQLLK